MKNFYGPRVPPEFRALITINRFNLRCGSGKTLSCRRTAERSQHGATRTFRLRPQLRSQGRQSIRADSGRTRCRPSLQHNLCFLSLDLRTGQRREWVCADSSRKSRALIWRDFVGPHGRRFICRNRRRRWLVSRLRLRRGRWRRFFAAVRDKRAKNSHQQKSGRFDRVNGAPHRFHFSC